MYEQAPRVISVQVVGHGCAEGATSLAFSFKDGEVYKTPSLHLLCILELTHLLPNITPLKPQSGRADSVALAVVWLPCQPVRASQQPLYSRPLKGVPKVSEAGMPAETPSPEDTSQCPNIPRSVQYEKEGGQGGKTTHTNPRQADPCHWNEG